MQAHIYRGIEVDALANSGPVLLLCIRNLRYLTEYVKAFVHKRYSCHLSTLKGPLKPIIGSSFATFHNKDRFDFEPRKDCVISE